MTSHLSASLAVWHAAMCKVTKMPLFSLSYTITGSKQSSHKGHKGH